MECKLQINKKQTKKNYSFEKGAQIEAVDSENFQMDVIYLTNKGGEIESKDEFGQTPLHYAAKCGNLDIFKFLVQRGADLFSKDCINLTPI